MGGFPLVNSRLLRAAIIDRSEQNMGCNGDLIDYAFSSHKTVDVVSESLYLLPASLMSAQTQDPC